MKFLILFLFLTLAGVSQTTEHQLIESLNDLVNANVRWKTLSRNDFTPADKNMIGKLINDSSNYFCLDFRIDGDYLDDFHLLDLDGDKDLDVVYEGFECSGHSTKTVLIYLNKNNRYEKVVSIPGKFASINPGSDLVLYNYPCCSMIENTLISYTIRRDTLIQNFGVTFFFSQVFKPFSKDYDLMFPKKLKAGNQYVVKATSGINYVPKDSLEQPVFLKESLAGSVSSDVNVTAYASVKDKQGIPWLYCRVAKEAVVLSNGKYTDYPVMVWIKQKDCMKPEP